MNETEPIAAEVTKLIELLSEGPTLKFPDLDAEALREASSRVEQRQEDVRKAEAALLVARGVLEEEHEALLKKAQRAHAYLRVYAETDATLAARVDAVALPRGRRVLRAEGPERPTEGEPMPKRRGRPRKVVDAAASLFSGEPAALGDSPTMELGQH